MEYINTNKLEKLNINPNNVYIALDFDRTITTKESQDSWGVVGMFLGQEFNKEIDKLYQKYRPIELDYNITFKNKEKAMIEWYGRCMNLYYKYKLTKEKLEESVKKSKLIFRDGAKEFLEKSNKENIQIIILSAGIGNVIEQFLKNNKINLDNIYIISNFIEFDKDGKMKEFDNSKIIHTLNKTMQGKIPSNIQKRINNIPNKILIGDLIEDENMIDQKQWDSTLKIAVFENTDSSTLDLYKKSFDVVLTNQDASFKYLNKIL